MRNVHSIAERPAGIPSTNVTNEITRAVNEMLPEMTEGQIEETGEMNPVVWVEIVDYMNDGVYRCIVGVPRTDTEFDPNSDDADFDFYDFELPEGSGLHNAYFVNQAEEGKTGHWLDGGGHYPGFRHPCPTTDGYPIIIYHTFDTQECEEQEPQSLVI